MFMSRPSSGGFWRAPTASFVTASMASSTAFTMAGRTCRSRATRSTIFLVLWETRLFPTTSGMFRGGSLGVPGRGSGRDPRRT